MKTTAIAIMKAAEQAEPTNASYRSKRFQAACSKLDATLAEAASLISEGYTTIVTFTIKECVDEVDLYFIKAELHRAGFVVRKASTGYPDDEAYVEIGLS